MKLGWRQVPAGRRQHRDTDVIQSESESKFEKSLSRPGAMVPLPQEESKSSGSSGSGDLLVSDSVLRLFDSV